MAVAEIVGEAPKLAGLRVLVTRPAAQAGGLCALIERAGGIAVRFASIEIAALQDTVNLERLVDRLNEFDIAIFVSSNAVTHAMTMIRARRGGLPPSLSPVCVGAGSAKALAEFGVTEILVPARTDSEGLLELAALQQVKGKRIVIFRGQGGRELLGETLAARGARIEYAECYRRLRPPTDATALAQAFDRGEIGIVIATSAEALRNLRDMLGTRAAARLAQTPIAVTSYRLHEFARELGIEAPVLVASTASDPAIVATIEAWRASQKNL